MAESFLGCELSVEVMGGLGFYQGRVVSVSTGSQSITLTRVIQNGRPAATSEITIRACDIIDLKILSRPTDNKDSSKTDSRPAQHPKAAAAAPRPAQQEAGQKQRPPSQHQSTTPQSPAVLGGVEVVGGGGGGGSEPPHTRRKPRTSVGETLAHGSHHHIVSNKEQPSDWQRSNPTSVTSLDFSSPRKSERYPSDFSRSSGKKDRMRRNRDETTFGTPIDDDMLATEFDFEKNLALFDKQAVIEEIQSLKPDVVRQADRFTEKKYRCDENVLATKPAPKRQIIVPISGAAEVIYANDSGLLVPSVTSELRATLLSTANQYGLTNSRQLEMIGRAATELILSISGASHRLAANNSHQPPVVVVMCGCHLQGAAGVNAARQLESHGVQTVVVTPQLPVSPPPPLLLTHELQLYALTSGRTARDPRALPSTLDLIVDARLDHHGRAMEGDGGQAWLATTTTWASSSRAPILALDPPSDLAAMPSTQPPLPARVLLCPSLPLAYTPARGKVYLMNLPIPQQTFTAVGIKYVSPFGAKLVVPLHPCE